MTCDVDKRTSGALLALDAFPRSLVQFALASAVVFTSIPVFATGNNMSGTCLNDVGRGALLWGTSSEVTTYSEPYLPYKTPYIYRIPTTAEQTSEPSPQSNIQDLQGHMGDAMERLSEKGTIFGTDGKVYEYHYVRGVEPRRVFETRRVQKSPNVWVNEQVERIVMQPTLIRVLRPAGTSQREAERDAAAAAAANSPKPCDPLSKTPEPCEPTGAAERQTYASPSANSAVASQTVPNNQPGNQNTPPVEGSTPTQSAEEIASVRIITPLAQTQTSQLPRPILVLPEELRKQTQAQNNGARNASGQKTDQTRQTTSSTNQRVSQNVNQGLATRR